MSPTELLEIAERDYVMILRGCHCPPTEGICAEPTGLQCVCGIMVKLSVKPREELGTAWS